MWVRGVFFLLLVVFLFGFFLVCLVSFLCEVLYLEETVEFLGPTAPFQTQYSYCF